MSRLRNAPLELRRAYQRALAALAEKSTVVFPPNLDTLTTVGAAIIDDRTLVFGVHGDHPRLWITTDAPEGPNLLGHLSGLVNEAPDLWICDHNAWPWVLSGDNAEQIEAAALRVWSDCLRDCDGLAGRFGATLRLAVTLRSRNQRTAGRGWRSRCSNCNTRRRR